MLVSYFNNIKQTTNGQEIELDDILTGIKMGKWEAICTPISAEQDKEKRAAMKERVPYFTTCGTFERRANTGLKMPSGMIAMDYDEQEIPHDIYDDPYVYAIFKSISKTGFCVISKIDHDKFSESFFGLADYFRKTFGLVADPACKDISRARFISHDQNLFLNHKAKVFKKYLPKETKMQAINMHRNYLHSDTKIDAVCKKIQEQRLDITGGYQQWLSLGFAIASKYGNSAKGYYLYNFLSHFSPLYDKKATDKQYAHCCRTWIAEKKVSIGTFYFYCLKHGIEVFTKEEKEAATIAQFAKEAGKTIEETKQLIGTDFADADNIINAALEKDYEDYDGDDINIDKLEKWLKINYSIKRNTVTRYLELNGTRIEPEKFNSIFIACKKRFKKLPRDLFDTLIFSEFIPSYNPIREYLDALIWDGQDHIGSLCRSITSDTGDYTYRYNMLTAWLIGVIEPIYGKEPSVLQLIFTGKQNTGKSHFFKYLLPAPLRQYFGLSQLDRGKDDEILMCQKLIIMDDEYSGKSKKTAELIKRILSSPFFDLREPYGRQNVTLPRIASLCATSNDMEVLNDHTGNRRNIVFEVTGRFDYDLYKDTNKEQVFAQLVHLLKETSASSILTDDDIFLLNAWTDEKHFEQTLEFLTLGTFFEEPSSDCTNFMTNDMIKNHIETNSQHKLNTRKLGLELRKMNFKRITKGGKYGYLILPKFINHQ